MKSLLELLSTESVNALAVLSLIVSVISIFVAVSANRTSRKALEQAEETASAELLKEYSDSFFEIKERLRPKLQELSIVCEAAERDVLALIDVYTPKDSRPLRHVLSDLCYNLSAEWLPKVLTENQIQYNGIFRTLWEYEFDHPKEVCVQTLNEILTDKDKIKLAEKLHSKLEQFWRTLGDLKSELQKAVLFIETSASKSRIAGYPISKNKALEAEMQKSRKIFYMVSMLDLDQIQLFGHDSAKEGYAISAYIYSVTVFRLIKNLIQTEECTIELDFDIEQEFRFSEKA